MSGSGKASVLRTLEDLGYYCVDNLPLSLIPTFADLMTRSSEVPRAALTVDIREGEALERFPALLQRLRRTIPVKLVFVEASDAALLRRFSETRRPHPLGEMPVREGIRQERARLESIRALSDVQIDTTRFTPHELRRFIVERFAEAGRARELLVNLISFGYRFGVPPDADLVFDVRFCPTPTLSRPTNRSPGATAACRATCFRSGRRKSSSATSAGCWPTCCRTIARKGRAT
jgi:UPF0042 nucleotide-binding protein